MQICYSYLMVSILLAFSLLTNILSSTALEKVTGVQVTDMTTSTATMSWKKQTSAERYQVRLRDADGNTVSKQKTKKLTLTLIDLDPDTTYSVQVRALRNSKTGKWSKLHEFSTTSETNPSYEDYKAVAGTSTGEWQNTTYGTSGGSTTTVEIDPDGRAAFTLDLDGLVFGLLNPDPKTYESTYDETGVVFTAEDDDLFGDLTITIVPNEDDSAQISFEGLNVPVVGISQINADGILTANSVDMNYEITFVEAFTAEGVMSLTK